MSSPGTQSPSPGQDPGPSPGTPGPPAGDWFPSDPAVRIAERTGRPVAQVRAALRRLADPRYRDTIRRRTVPRSCIPRKPL